MRGLEGETERRKGTDVEERLKRRLRLMEQPRQPEVDEGPCCVYGLVTRASLENLAKDVEEVKGRVNTLLWGMGGTVLLEVVLRLAGG